VARDDARAKELPLAGSVFTVIFEVSLLTTEETI